jgi:ATP-dependent DNA helicase RecG
VTADPLQEPLTSLTGVGPRRAAALARVGLHTVEDLLLRCPLRYEDRGRLTPLATLRPGSATARGVVTAAHVRPTRRPRFTVYEVVLQDASGSCRAVWFNQPFLAQAVTVGQDVILHGQVEWTGQGPQFVNPDHEPVRAERGEAEAVHTGRIVPVYERIGPLTSKLQRSLAHQALARLPADVPDPLPESVRVARGLPTRAEALRTLHFPGETCDVADLAAFRTPAQVRLILEEFFLFQLALAEQRLQRTRAAKSHRMTVTPETRAMVRRLLPFPLTAGQKQALAGIVADMQRPEPMNRLLQGDVGSGKTLVAVIAAVVAMASGLQVAIMVPTDLLAQQHARSLDALLAGTPFTAALVTGTQTPRQRRQALARLAEGQAQCAIGTHALLEDVVCLPQLGLVVIDEQHRFGVGQRALLRAKAARPDVLVMTATPIPRTLALTAFGDLDVSVIADRPPGRLPIRTAVRPAARRDEVYAFVRDEVAAGRQAYVVLPLVEASDTVDARAAVTTADDLQRGALASVRVGLLHGRLPAADKARVMDAFAGGGVDVLVATTVVEVGVDVPNATVMVVEHADRFGLSQLHQLRGRVGRGTQPSSCVLLYDSPLSDIARARLEAMAESGDGFALAERDLALRGPGDVFGTRQAGMPLLRIGSLVRDQAIMAEAHRLARDWVETLPVHAPERVLARQAWAGRFNLAHVG